MGYRFSIHAKHKKSEEMGAALDEVPLLVPGTENVFHLVMASGGSYGAASYLLRQPEGNVMVDSPRFDAKLLDRIQVDAFEDLCWPQSTGAPLFETSSCTLCRGLGPAQ